MPITNQTKKANVCFIILTCEKYLPTRVKWQNDTCFKDVSKADCYFLSCKPSGDNVYGWDTPDDYSSCALKYIRFFQHMALTYDWYMFIDDDTFVYPTRIHDYLARFDPSSPLYIGAMWDNPTDPYMSGGAGFFLSHSSYTVLQKYIAKNVDTICKDITTIYGDMMFGKWIKRAMEDSNLSLSYLDDQEYLKKGHHSNTNELTRCISFHYVTNESLFYFYNLYMKNTYRESTRIVGYPAYNSIVSISPAGYSTFGIRHSGYKCSSMPIEPDNHDFLFIVRPARNGCKDDISFQSLNYREHYLCPSNTRNIYIYNIANNLDNESWKLIYNETTSTLSCMSLSKDPNMSQSYLSVHTTGTGDVYIATEGNNNQIQSWNIYEYS